MAQTVTVDGEIIDEYTIRVSRALKGVTGKVKVSVQTSDEESPTSGDEFDRYFMALNFDFSDYTFDRNQANER